jgi:hypothetical protein
MIEFSLEDMVPIVPSSGLMWSSLEAAGYAILAALVKKPSVDLRITLKSKIWYTRMMLNLWLLSSSLLVLERVHAQVVSIGMLCSERITGKTGTNRTTV